MADEQGKNQILLNYAMTYRKHFYTNVSEVFLQINLRTHTFEMLAKMRVAFHVKDQLVLPCFN